MTAVITGYFFEDGRVSVLCVMICVMHLPGPKGAPGELERDWGQGMEGQDTGNSFPLPEGRDGWDIGQELSPGTVGVHREAVAVPGVVPLTGIVVPASLPGQRCLLCVLSTYHNFKRLF